MTESKISRSSIILRNVQPTRFALLNMLSHSWLCFLAMLVLGGGDPIFCDGPNVVLIMVDDMGYNELGVTGQLQRAASGENHIQTPTIDFLAENGLRLTHFYASPICASSRCALMTGFHNGHSAVDRNGGNNGGNAIRDEDFTIGELFQNAGYQTGQFGKWGLGGYDHTQAPGGFNDPDNAVINFPNAIPTVQGFDEYYGYLNQLRAHSYYQQYQWEQDGVGGLQVHLTNVTEYSHDLMAERALNFVATHYQSPFFLYLPFTIPHSDFDPPQDSIYNAFINAGYSVNQARYAAMMKRLDNSIEDLLQRLQDPNEDGMVEDSILDETLILFCSDNGGTPQNSLFQGGGNLRGEKGSVHEGGIATPLIAYWNGTIAPGQINTSRIGSIDDLLVTCADLIGVTPPIGSDGGSLADLISGQVVFSPRPYHVFEARNNNDWAIRFGDWKLSKAGSNVMRLFALSQDPNEVINLIGAQPAIASLLEEIALAEGVESDAGNGAAQTTHIVQYKQWSPQGGSSDFSSPDNWVGGTAVNTRGTPVNNFDTGPAENWIASVHNTTGMDVELDLDSTARVLALEIKSESSTVRLNQSGTLVVNNGTRIGNSGCVRLLGGQLLTCRNVEIMPGGASFR